jgi:hypothetical protein
MESKVISLKDKKVLFGKLKDEGGPDTISKCCLGV